VALTVVFSVVLATVFSVTLAAVFRADDLATGNLGRESR